MMAAAVGSTCTLPKLSELRLRVRDVDSTAAWYEKIGFTRDVLEDGATALRSPGSGSCCLVLLPVAASAADPAKPEGAKPAFVWVGLGLFTDVDASAASLKEVGVEVRIQGQFEDVGYVAHMSDNNGVTLELLQTVFAANFMPAPEKLPANVLKANAIIAQAKFNIVDVDKNLHFYTKLLGMKLLSRQRVRFGFTLFFLAHTEEKPPSDDPDAVENREWLWQRDFAQVELQHWDTVKELWLPAEGEPGFDSLSLRCPSEALEAAARSLAGAGLSTTAEANGFSVEDPDGRRIVLRAA
eukprot:TRINITY_DN103973_c0_g1_i1.p1 TRINITY_DN103973_c0_g1~~TRINITY_DN103973_c0_g1_i1.p1  ORF type:complete len:297 (+),score=89.69 TRINITY_DN103973_c0_g1_i1:46-936(+)